MFHSVSTPTRSADASYSSQHPERPIDQALVKQLLANWNQLLNAPSMEGRDDKADFKDISISKDLLRAFAGELTEVKKCLLASALMMIIYDEPVKNPKRDGNKITAKFGDGSKLNIHNAWGVVCEVNNDNQMRMLRVVGTDRKAMAELNLDSSNVASSKSVSSPRLSSIQNQLLDAFENRPSIPRKRPAEEIENADEIENAEKGGRGVKTYSTSVIDLSRLLEANINSYVGTHFVQTLKDMLTEDLVTENPTAAQKADNTYRATWVLPAQKRFFAALLQTAHNACKHHKIVITPENSHTILQHAFDALDLTEDAQKEKEINESLIAAHQSTNNSKKTLLTMRVAMEALPQFTEISKVNEIFQRVVDEINTTNSNQKEVDPLQMWRHCVERSTIDYLQANLPFDRDNPFLLYIEDTKEKSSLLNNANAWDFITQNVDQDLTPEFLMKLWDIHSNNGTPFDNKNIPIPDDNENYTCLMMLDDDSENAEHATLTKEGLRELKEKIGSSAINRRYEVSIILGNKADKKDSLEYRKKIVTLERQKTDVEKLQNLLENTVKSCNVQIAAAGEDKDALLAAELKLGMDLTQLRQLPDLNNIVGMMANNFLRLKNNQSVPFSLPNADKLDGYTLDQILEIAKQEELGDD